jgi:hypothetical protein
MYNDFQPYYKHICGVCLYSSMGFVISVADGVEKLDVGVFWYE